MRHENIPARAIHAQSILAIVGLCLLGLLALAVSGCTQSGAWDMFSGLRPDGSPGDGTEDPGAPLDPLPSSYAHELVFDNSGQSEALVNFPVLVTLTPARVDYGSIAPDGSDIRFADGDTGSELPYEIEAWNPGGTSLLWVAVPRIDGSSAVDGIMLYYGDGAAVPGENAPAVWNAGYLGVWHLAGNANDSTAHLNHGVENGSTAAPGRIGGGREFFGSSNIRITATPEFDLTGALTMEAWAQKRSVGDQIVMAKTKYASNNRSYALGFDWNGLTNGPYAELSDDGNHVGPGFVENPGNEADDIWLHLAAVYDGSVLILYVDGAEAGRQEPSVPSLNTNGTDFFLGAGANGNANELDGFIDEARLSDVARSADWIAAQYLSMTDAFITYGPKQTL